MLWQPSLPEVYRTLSEDELAARIDARRKELGDSLFILGHHYQTDQIIRHADATGDSLKLSQIAARVATERPVKYVVFCGVHFMAETADMLTPDHVAVILPDLSAGCSMADMAQYDDTVEAWEAIQRVIKDAGQNARVVPITYVNSSAAIKAFVGAHGGACCTSSNARQVFAWARAGGTIPTRAGEKIKVLFLPDQHLGRNTAAAAGIDVDTRAALYDPRAAHAGKELGGSSREAIERAEVILWAGHCSVHKLFRPEHCRAIREESEREKTAGTKREAVKVLVHPECCKEVVDLADMSGSTEFIIQAIRASAPGSRWAVGTETHLVGRLAKEAAARGVEVRILSDCQCLCTTMYRIDEPRLLWALDHLAGGLSKSGKAKIVNQISVPAKVRKQALLAVDRMLELSKPAATASVD